MLALKKNTFIRLICNKNEVKIWIYTIYPIMSNMLKYKKYLGYIKWWLLNYAKMHKYKLVIEMYKKYLKFKN